MRGTGFRTLTILLLPGLLSSGPALAQQTAPASIVPAINLTLHAGPSTVAAEALLDPEARAWEQSSARRVALNRTPPLYDTDTPAELEIPEVEVRAARASGKLLVHLQWQDRTQDFAALARPPTAPPEQRDLKEHSAATNRFFDAAAVMLPSRPSGGTLSPSLQMGDPAQPVTIYYWNAVRGAMLMEARGRGTTRRTGQSFAARGVYRAGAWHVTFE
jgi:hypothetical protein